MRGKTKRAASMALALLLLLALLPAGAAAGYVIAGGECGENVTWTLDSDGVLTITGIGEITSHPWMGDYSGDITEVVISYGVKGIGDGAFIYCSAITSVTIPGSVKYIGQRAFAKCLSLTGATIPAGVTSIGPGAFESCISLAEVTIPNGATTIGDGAFYGCFALTEAAIPASVTSIGYIAFEQCTALTGFSVDKNNPAYKDVDGVLFNKSGTELIQYPAARGGAYTIPAGVTTVADAAFAYAASLTEATVPNGVTKLGGVAFYQCPSLTRVNLGSSVESIGDHAFDYCAALRDVYYAGSEADWAAVAMETGNDELLNATMHFITPLKITKQPADYIGAAGTKAVFTVEARGDGLTYQWFIKNPTAAKFSKSSVTKASYTVTLTADNSGRQLYCVVTDQYGSSVQTNTVSMTMKEAAFDAPVLKSASAGTNGITVTWNAVSGATTYRVYRKTGSGGWTALKDVTGTGYTDTAVTGGTTYTYTVKAYNGSAWSGFDAKGVSATAKDVFGAPVLKSASAGTNGITVSWNAVSGATQYRVYRKTGSGGWTGLKDVTGTSYTDTAVTSGTTYTYTVKAYNGSAWSGFDSKGVSATAKDAFGAPVLKSASAGTNGITVSWNAVSGATQYRVYRKTGSGGWTGLKDVTGTSYTDTAVTGGTTYTYTVKAYNGSAWSGFDAKGVSATAKDIFGAPVLKSASAGTNGITVTWNAVSGATQYRVYRRTGSGGWTGLKDVTGTSYTDAAVTSGTTYTYTVKAYNGSAWSGFDAGGISATAK